MDTMEKNKELYLAILNQCIGRDLVGSLKDFYEKIFYSTADILMFTTRKAYVLSQVFKNLIENYDEDYKIVITDKTLPFILKELENRKITIIDDSVIYGRNINKLYKSLIDFGVDKSNISISIFSENASNDPNIEAEHKYIYSSVNNETCQYRTSVFMDAIKMTSVPYVSCVPAFELPLNEFNDFINMSFIESTWKKTQIYSFNNNTYDVSAHVYYKEDFCSELFDFFGIRIYLNKCLEKAVIVPNAIITTLHKKIISKIYKAAIEYFVKAEYYLDYGDETQLEDVQDSKAQAYLISYFLSYVCFGCFIDEIVKEKDKEKLFNALDFHEEIGIHNFRVELKDISMFFDKEECLKILENILRDIHSDIEIPDIKSLYKTEDLSCLNEIIDKSLKEKREFIYPDKEKIAFLFNLYGNRERKKIAEDREKEIPIDDVGLKPIKLEMITKCFESGRVKTKKEEVISNMFYTLDTGKAGMVSKEYNDFIYNDMRAGEANFTYLQNDFYPAFSAVLNYINFIGSLQKREKQKIQTQIKDLVSHILENKNEIKPYIEEVDTDYFDNCLKELLEIEYGNSYVYICDNPKVKYNENAKELLNKLIEINSRF